MLERNFGKILGFLCFLTFDLMLLGAAVRAMDAGLTCPDWPLCFGRAVPEYHLGVYLEFIHRAVAGVVAIIFSILYVYVFINKKLQSLRWLMTVALLLLLAQIIMGGLTVLKLLQPGIVTMHLGLATAFLMSLLWIRNKHTPAMAEVAVPRKYLLLTVAGVALVCGQILLGGWVASNYAGLVCVDFPLCNGQWFPAWTGPIGAQVIHRLGAYTLAAFFTFFFFYSLGLARSGKISRKDSVLAAQAFVIILSQVMVGIFNLKLLVPVWLTVIHLGLAIYLLNTTLKIYFRHHR